MDDFAYQLQLAINIFTKLHPLDQLSTHFFVRQLNFQSVTLNILISICGLRIITFKHFLDRN